MLRTRAEVVDFFDERLVEHAAVPELVRAAAGFAGAAVGVCTDRRTGLASTSDGAVVDCVPPPTATVMPLLTGGGNVWMLAERADVEDVEHFLHRCNVALAASGVEAALAAIDDTMPLDTLLDPDRSAQDRDRALEALRLSPTAPIRLLAARGASQSWRTLLDALVAQGVHPAAQASIGEVRVALIVESERAIWFDDVPAGMQVGLSRVMPARAIQAAMRNARAGLRFSLVSPRDHGPYQLWEQPFIHGDRLGVWEVLCALTREQIDEVGDVQALDRLVAELGADSSPLHVLEAYGSTTTLRRAADLLHMHHSSVAYWVERAEVALGFPLKGRNARNRLILALCLYRVRNSLI